MSYNNKYPTYLNHLSNSFQLRKVWWLVIFLVP